jgi:hypothetical protein
MRITPISHLVIGERLPQACARSACGSCTPLGTGLRGAPLHQQDGLTPEWLALQLAVESFPGETTDEVGPRGDTRDVEIVVTPLDDRENVGERGAVRELAVHP